jgi:hypothetical protein
MKESATWNWENIFPCNWKLSLCGDKSGGVPVFSPKKDGEPNTHDGEKEKKKDPIGHFGLVGDDASVTTLQCNAAYHLLF